MRRSIRFASLVALPVVLGTAHPAYAGNAPMVAKVRLVQEADGLKARIFGAHFGKSPVPLPCIKCSINEFQLFYFANGEGRNTEPVTIKQWSDSYIQLSDVNGTPGTAAVFAIKNDSLGKGGKTGSGAFTLPGGPPGPVIRRLIFSRQDKHLKLRIYGRGFGSAPAGVPGTTDIGYFQFWIWVPDGGGTNYPWTAGHVGDYVTLNYESWSDSLVVISGFGPDYRDGSEDWVARRGFAVAVTLSNNPGGGAFGPSTSKATRIMAGLISIPLRR